MSPDPVGNVKSWNLTQRKQGSGCWGDNVLGVVERLGYLGMEISKEGIVKVVVAAICSSSFVKCFVLLLHGCKKDSIVNFMNNKLNLF